jgi:hypothetical protein
MRWRALKIYLITTEAPRKGSLKFDFVQAQLGNKTLSLDTA